MGEAALMCSGLFSKPDTSAAQAATLLAQTQMRDALQTQLDARTSAENASDSASESARLANEAALRRLARGGMFGASDSSDGPAPVGTRQLFGS